MVMMAMEMQRAKSIKTEKDEGVSGRLLGWGAGFRGQAKSAEATSRGPAGAARAVKPTWGLSRVLVAWAPALSGGRSTSLGGRLAAGRAGTGRARRCSCTKIVHCSAWSEPSAMPANSAY
jgi:hypothetical protein